MSLAKIFKAFPGTVIVCTQATMTRRRLSLYCDVCGQWVWMYRKDGTGFCFAHWQVEGKKVRREENRSVKLARAAKKERLAAAKASLF